MPEFFGNNCTNDATLRLACAISIRAHVKAQCRTAIRRVRWLLAHYDLKVQTGAVEGTENTQTDLNIVRLFIQIARALFGQILGPCPLEDVRLFQDFASFGVGHGPADRCRAATEETRPKIRIT